MNRITCGCRMSCSHCWECRQNQLTKPVGLAKQGSTWGANLLQAVPGSVRSARAGMRNQLAVPLSGSWQNTTSGAALLASAGCSSSGASVPGSTAAQPRAEVARQLHCHCHCMTACCPPASSRPHDPELAAHCCPAVQLSTSGGRSRQVVSLRAACQPPAARGMPRMGVLLRRA